MGHLVKVERIGEIKDDTLSGDKTEIQTTTYEWNQRGLVTGIINPLGAEESFSYDQSGRMTDKWDRDGHHTAYSYDKRGLLKDILYEDGTSVAYSYDALRRLEEVKDSIGTTRIVTDALGRVSSVTDPQGKTVGYEWGSMDEKQRLVYPDGKKASYDYNDKGQLDALTTPKGTIRYAYDAMGRLKGKAFPNGITTEYSYDSIGNLEKINHSGNGFEEEYHYQYDMAGNKIGACKQRQGMDADSGSFQYGHDALNRLTEVSRDGSLLRKYTYDAFGNRTAKEDYSGQAVVQTTYRYNANNQMISRVNEEEQAYTYDHRGNLIAVSRGEEQFKTFAFDAANRMHSAFEIKDGIGTRAEYTYNAFGNRIGQDIYSMEPDDSIPETDGQKPQNPERQIYYTLDLTRQYHNLLVSEDKAGQIEQTFYWDGNVAAMEEEERDSYYLQDDLGSPMQLMDEEGKIRETYGFDEFGLNLDDRPEKKIQPFGYTGYQMEAAGGLYFAQARRYDAGAGRFVSEDKVSGFTSAPYTLNRYNYCWNQPMEHVDLNGKIPWILIPLAIGLALGLTGCGKEEEKNPPEDYRQEDSKKQNCYSYAFQLPLAACPGDYYCSLKDDYSDYMFKDKGIYTPEEITEFVLRDMDALGKNVRVINSPEEAEANEYVVAMKTSTKLVPGTSIADFHFAVLLSDGTWADKAGDSPSRWNVIDGTWATWDTRGVKDYYNTESVYFAVEVCDN